MTPKVRPGDPLDQSARMQVQQALLPRKPQVARVITGNAVHFAARNPRYDDEPPVLEVAESAVRIRPESAGMILKQRLHGVVWKPVCPKVCLHLSILPSGQTVMGPYPDTPVRGREHRARHVARQPLPHGDGADRQLPKAIQPCGGGDPYAAFTILEDAEDDVARKAVRLGERVRPAVMDVDEPALDGSDPEAAVAVPQQLVGVADADRIR